jgi:hypothetical protein
VINNLPIFHSIIQCTDSQEIKYNGKSVQVSLYCWNKKPAISEMEDKIAQSWQVELDEIF